MRIQRIASIRLRRVATCGLIRSMILRSAGLAVLWLSCTAGLFLVLDLYT